MISSYSLRHFYSKIRVGKLACRPNSGISPFFVNKVVLEHGNTHLFAYNPWLLSCCNNCCIDHEVKNICYLALTESFQTLGLNMDGYKGGRLLSHYNMDRNTQAMPSTQRNLSRRKVTLAAMM